MFKTILAASISLFQKPSQPTDQTKKLGDSSVGKNTYSAIMRA